MTHFATTCPDEGQSHRSVLAALGSAALRALLWPARVIAARRALAQLTGLSDYELRDIGLSRQDLVDLTARPLDDDPTLHLADARAERARLAHNRRIAA
jgi:uncharacterized protein YjiS (DUF1127 family)